MAPRAHDGRCTHNAANELQTDSVWNYTYDAEGDLNEKFNISTVEIWDYEYDYLNRLTEVTHRTSGGVVKLLARR